VSRTYSTVRKSERNMSDYPDYDIRGKVNEGTRKEAGMRVCVCV
jgi:hypothetical protein